MAAAGQQNTTEYKELSEQIGIYKKVIIDTDMQVDALSQTTAQKMGGALSGVTSGFELSAGAMGAMGAESEEVEAALLKVQSAMAISQGIDGIRQSIPAFKAMKNSIMANTVVQKIFNAVMKANPIGLIIVAITALISAGYALVKMFNIFGEEQESAAESSARLTSELEKQDKAMEKANAKREKEHAQKMRRLDIEEASERDRLAAVLDNLDKEQEGRKEDLKNAKKALEDLKVEKNKAREEEEWELAQEIQDQLEAKRKSYNELVILVKDHKQNVLDTTQEGNKKIAAEEKAEADKKITAYKEYLSRKKAAEDTHLAVLRELKAHELSLIEDEFTKERAIIKNNFKIKREDLLANFTGTEEDKAALRSAYNTQEQIALNESHAKEVEAAKVRAQELADAKGVKEFGDLAVPVEEMPEVIAEEIKGQALFDIKKKWNDKAEEMRDISASKAFKRTADGLANASSALNALDELNNALTDAAVAKAGDNEAAAEKARKKGFERSKKLQLTMAVITGIQGVMAAFTAGSSMGPAGVVMGPLLGALAAVTAGINISKISKMKYQGGGGGGKPATGPATPPSVPSFNIAGNSTENQLATSLGGQEQQPIKAMVVSTEVTTAQSLDRNKVETASL
jgi:hypothetical protein